MFIVIEEAKENILHFPQGTVRDDNYMTIYIDTIKLRVTKYSMLERPWNNFFLPADSTSIP